MHSYESCVHTDGASCYIKVQDNACAGNATQIYGRRLGYLPLLNAVTRARLVLRLFFFATLLIAFFASAQTKIACIGNSITYGYGLSNREKAYPSLLEKLLGPQEYSVKNYGVNSATMTKLGNVPYWTTGMLQTVFDFQPDIITIKLGTNDTKPVNWEERGYGTEFESDYLSMIDTLRTMESDPTVFAVLPVPVFSNPTGASWGIRDTVLQKLLPIIRRVAEEKNIAVIDCNTPLKDFAHCFSADGVHPDAVGEDTIAHVIYRALVGEVFAVRSPSGRRSSSVPVSIKVDANRSVVLSVRSGGSWTIHLFNIHGKRVANEQISGSQPVFLSCASMRSGVYIIRGVSHLSSQRFSGTIELLR